MKVSTARDAHLKCSDIEPLVPQASHASPRLSASGKLTNERVSKAKLGQCGEKS